jgi:ABC-2 type transporter
VGKAVGRKRGVQVELADDARPEVLAAIECVPGINGLTVDGKQLRTRATFASLSNGLAVLTRERETLIGAVSMVVLPLTFLSSTLMQQRLLPDWVRWVARFNPVNWAVEAGRSAATQNADWSLIARGAGSQQILATYALQGVISTAAAVSFSVSMQVGVTAVNTAVGLAATMLLFRTMRPIAAARSARARLAR